MKNLYRRYKISQLLDEPLLDKDKEIIDFILDKIKDLTLYIDEDGCHNYMNSKCEFIFQHDDKNGMLWVRYQDFWSVLEYKYLLNDVDIQVIIKDMVETAYKMSVVTPMARTTAYWKQVETAYKMSVGTPYYLSTPSQMWVETAYKMSVGIKYNI
jgi:PAS domain-containing protein